MVHGGHQGLTTNVSQWFTTKDKRRNSTKSKITPLNCSRAESDLLKNVLGRVQQGDTLKGIDVQEIWSIFKDHDVKAKE